MADYANISMPAVENLFITDYWLLLRDAVVYGHSQTSEGREYLEKCWTLEQTEPDRNALRNRFEKK